MLRFTHLCLCRCGGCGDLHSTFFPFDLILIFIFSSLFNKTLLFSISHFSHPFFFFYFIFLIFFCCFFGPFLY